jgi:hypothetical protein
VAKRWHFVGICIIFALGMEHVSPYAVLLGPKATDHGSKSK